MVRRGPELSPQMRARICELRPLGWSYDRIQKRYPEIPYSTIGDTCRKEAQRLNNFSKRRPGAPRVITEEARDSLLETDSLLLKYHTKLYEHRNALMRACELWNNSFKEMNIRKWVRLKRPALTPEHAGLRLRHKDIGVFDTWTGVEFVRAMNVQSSLGKARSWTGFSFKAGKANIQPGFALTWSSLGPVGEKGEKRFGPRLDMEYEHLLCLWMVILWLVVVVSQLESIVKL